MYVLFCSWFRSESRDKARLKANEKKVSSNTRDNVSQLLSLHFLYLSFSRISLSLSQQKKNETVFKAMLKAAKPSLTAASAWEEVSES